MSQFKTRHLTPNEQQDMKIPISLIGMDFNFYIPSPGYENSGLVFRVAYDAAKQSSNPTELCTYVGSMLCAVSNNLRTSVLEALKGLGVELCFVELPFQAREYGINLAQNQITQMDWPFILVNFAYLCILLFKKTNLVSYLDFLSCHIRELQKRVGCESSNGYSFNVPFDLCKAIGIRTMLGSSLTLRTSVIKLIMSNMNQGPAATASIGKVRQYLFDILSWSDMDELIMLNHMLVIPQSSALRDPKNSREAEKLREAIAAIEAHPYPQFFMLLASNEELMKVDNSRFPSLINYAGRKQSMIRR